MNSADHLAFYGVNPQHAFETFQPKTNAQKRSKDGLKFLAKQAGDILKSKIAVKDRKVVDLFKKEKSAQDGFDHGRVINLYGRDQEAKKHLADAFVIEAVKHFPEVRERLGVIGGTRSFESLLLAAAGKKPNVLVANEVLPNFNQPEDLDLTDLGDVTSLMERIHDNCKLVLVTSNFSLDQVVQKIRRKIEIMGISGYSMDPLPGYPKIPGKCRE